MKVAAAIALIILALAPSVLSFGSGCPSIYQKGEKIVFPPPTTLPQNLKVAFIGDAGWDSNQRKVLQMIKSSGAAFVVHSGDFEYSDSPSTFENNINAVLGSSYPYFASIGNHDAPTWSGTSGHQARLLARLARVNATKNCVGDFGVNSACNYQGLYFVLSGVGTRGSSHATYIDQAFTGYKAIWKFVSWHKNQRLMQIGSKTDETGWSVYEAALKHGAFVATGHEHSFCRSHLMSSFQNQVVASTSNTVQLSPGKSMVFVSGLAGVGIRSWDSTLKSKPYWAAVGATNNNVQYGAMLCTFNVGGDTRRADCQFKDVNGKVWDQFTMRSSLASTEEELPAHLQTPSEIEEKFIEIPVKSSEGDAFEGEDGIIHCDTQFVELHSGISIYKFENVPIEKGQKVQQAQIQFFGQDSDFNAVTPRYQISAFITKKNEELFSCSKDSRKHQLSELETEFTTFIWTEDVGEEWETGTVWVSQDISDLINQVVSSEQWTYGSSIHLRILGDGKQTIRSFDHSACFAPTFTIEF